MAGPARCLRRAGYAGGDLAAPPGFEPGLSAPKADVLPLHHGAIPSDSIVRRRAAIVKTPRFPVAFIFRWFGYKIGVQCPPTPPPEMRRYGTATPPGNPTGTPCDQCRLAMHRHHRYARANATGYGEVRLQIPVFRCGQCRRMASVMPLPGDEMRHRRFSKKTVTSPLVWPRRD